MAQNYSIKELATLLVKSILEETFLNEKTLIPKVEAWIRTMVDLKNEPKNYNAYESKSTAARRLRTIEQKDAEIVFWRDVVKTLDGENIKTYYEAQQKMLIDKGFLKSEA